MPNAPAQSDFLGGWRWRLTMEWRLAAARRQSARRARVAPGQTFRPSKH